MRLKVIKDCSYMGITYAPQDIVDVSDADGIRLINRNYAVPFNLEDPSQRSPAVNVPAEAPVLPDVPPVTLSAISASLDDLGGPVQFTVTVDGPGVSGTWTVDKDAGADWLTVSSPTTPQTESGDVIADVAANVDATERTANLYINGKTFTVNQAGVAATTSRRKSR